MQLAFVIHNHQPVGNFEHVFEEAFQKAYLPFWDVFEDASHVSIGLHMTGPLLDFIQEKHPKFIDRIGKQVENRRVELLGGGLYEPILSIIPFKDARGQVNAMSDRLKSLFGVRPTGMWLAERVWEPDIPSILDGTGIDYTLVDDSVFAFSGIPIEKCNGYWVTENRGYPLKVLPISMDLRYYFPFKPVPQVKEFLSAKNEENPDLALTFGDDGEKFGNWPETHEWVYGKKWLDKFFQFLADESSWIQTIKPYELASITQSRGRVYLPQASYEEMLEWALPTEASLAFKEFKHSFDPETVDRIKPFLRGGIWANFLAKYPEADWLHKRMILLSDSLRRTKLPETTRAKAYDHLYKAQCNCAYWHGLFGGIYLNYLRHALWENLIAVENILYHKNAREKTDSEYRNTDLNCDGKTEWLIENSRFFAAVIPDEGASVAEIDLRDWNFNIANVIARREEAFHREYMEHRSLDEKTDGVKSIHEISRSKVEGIEELLTFDKIPRYSFQDFVSIQDDDGNQRNLDLEWNKYQDSAFVGEADIFKSPPLRLSLKKEYSLKDATFKCDYTLQSNFTGEIKIVTRFNLTLLAGHADDRYLAIDGEPLDPPFMDSIHSIEAIDGIELHDDWKKLKISLDASPGVTKLDISPIITVSSSENGLEPTYQGTCFEFTRLLKGTPEGTEFEYSITAESKGEKDD